MRGWDTSLAFKTAGSFLLPAIGDRERVEEGTSPATTLSHCQQVAGLVLPRSNPQYHLIHTPLARANSLLLSCSSGLESECKACYLQASLSPVHFHWLKFHVVCVCVCMWLLCVCRAAVCVCVHAAAVCVRLLCVWLLCVWLLYVCV